MKEKKKNDISKILLLFLFGIGFCIGFMVGINLDKKRDVIVRTKTVTLMDTVVLDSVIQFIELEGRSVIQVLPTSKFDTIVITYNDTLELLRSIGDKMNLDIIRIYYDSVFTEAARLDYKIVTEGRLLSINPKVTLIDRKEKHLTKFKKYKWGITAHSGAYLYNQNADWVFGASINYKNYYLTGLRNRDQGYTFLLGYQIRF